MSEERREVKNDCVGLLRSHNIGLTPLKFLFANRRFADTNGFLCESADSCIDIVISNASDIRCLNAFLASAGSKLPAVRAKSAAVVLRCIQRADPGKLQGSRDMVKLLKVLAQFCQDRNGETRR